MEFLDKVNEHLFSHRWVWVLLLCINFLLLGRNMGQYELGVKVKRREILAKVFFALYCLLNALIR